MALTLTPEQQAKLDQFEMDAQAAGDAEDAATKSTADLLALEQQNGRDKQTAIDDMSAALASGQAFIDAMLGRKPK